MTALVAGAAGGFGRIFVGLLAAAGYGVVAVDTLPAASGARFLVADVTAPSAELSAELAEADVLVLCIPEAALFPALSGLLGPLPRGALVVDVTSVKSRYAEAALAVRPDLELCSLEPLFAPDVGFVGQQVLVAQVRAGRRAAAFVELVRGTGAEVIQTTVDAVDRRAAATQVAAHAALIAYGAALRELDADPTGPDTALQRALMTLLARVATRDPNTYWHIQRDNPYAAEARAALRAALDGLDRLVEAGDRDGFARLVAAAGASTGPRLEELAKRSAAVVAAAAGGAPDDPPP